MIRFELKSGFLLPARGSCNSGITNRRKQGHYNQGQISWSVCFLRISTRVLIFCWYFIDIFSDNFLLFQNRFIFWLSLRRQYLNQRRWCQRNRGSWRSLWIRSDFVRPTSLHKTRWEVSKSDPEGQTDIKNVFNSEKTR